MTERVYRTINKSTWGDGPWQAEPDKVQGVDAATGLPFLAVRSWHSGNWCGYVGVDPDHPLFGRHYTDDGFPDLDAHGGVNYADGCMEGLPEDQGVCHIPEPGQPDHVWWFGFDCHHSQDFAPGYAAEMRRLVSSAGNTRAYTRLLDHLEAEGAYRDLAYVREECARLAAQLAAIAGGRGDA